MQEILGKAIEIKIKAVHLMHLHMNPYHEEAEIIMSMKANNANSARQKAYKLNLKKERIKQ